MSHSSIWSIIAFLYLAGWIVCTHCYRPKTMLWEGNIFTGVRPLGGEVHHMHHRIGHMVGFSTPWTSNLGTYPLPLDIRPSYLPLPCYWHLVVVTGDLFKLVHPQLYWQDLYYIYYSGGHWTHIVCKRAVLILLECCLVCTKIVCL